MASPDRGRRRSLDSVNPHDISQFRSLRAHHPAGEQVPSPSGSHPYGGSQDPTSHRFTGGQEMSHDSVQGSQSQVDWESSDATLQDVSFGGESVKPPTSHPLRSAASLDGHRPQPQIQKSAVFDEMSLEVDASTATLHQPDHSAKKNEHCAFPEPEPAPIDKYKQAEALNSLEASFGPFHAAHAHAKRKAHLSFWARILRDCFLVNLFFFTPAAALIHYTSLQLYMVWAFPWSDQPEPAWTQQQVMLEVARFLLLVWLVLTSSLVSRLGVHFFLHYALVIAEAFFGRASEKLKTVVDYTEAVQKNIHFVTSMVAMTVGFYILMPYTGDKQHFHGVLMLICVCVLVASIMILIEKILLQRLGVNFHAVAYKERLQACNYGITVVRQLSTAISKKRIPNRMKGIKTVFKQSRRNGGRSPVRFQGASISTTGQSAKAYAADYMSSMEMVAERSPSPTYSPSDPAPIYEEPTQYKRTLSEGDVRLGDGKEGERSLSPSFSPQKRRGGRADLLTNNDGLRGAASMDFVPSHQKSASFSPSRRSAFSISTEGGNQMRLPALASSSVSISPSLTSSRNDSSTSQEAAAASKGATKTARFRTRAQATEREAARLSKRLHTALLSTGESKNLTLHNFMPYFPEFEQAQAAFEYFDTLRLGEVTQDLMTNRIQTLFKERLFLSSSFRDMSQVLSNMDRLAMSFTILIIIFTSVIIMNGSSAITGLYSFSSFFLGLSFVFGDAAKTLFNSCIFVFIVHPFDVGDKITVDGVWFEVIEMNLWTTVLCRWDGVQTISTNVYLYAKLICNIRRSTGMAEYVRIDISIDTPPAKILKLQTELGKYLATEAREWLTNTNMNVQIADTSIAGIMTLQFSLRHRNNWIDGDRRWHTRNAFIHKLQNTFKDLGIEQPACRTIKSIPVT